MWQRIKMFNTKLMTTNVMRRLRIWVLESVCPFEGMTLFSASCATLSGGATVATLLTQGTFPRVATSGSSLILVILAAGTLSLLLFQGVCPVILLISPSMALESCALNVGSPNGFPTGLVWAGGIPPHFLPRSGHLGSMVAGNLHPWVGTLRYKIVDWPIGQSSGVDGM